MRITRRANEHLVCGKFEGDGSLIKGIDIDRVLREGNDTDNSLNIFEVIIKTGGTIQLDNFRIKSHNNMLCIEKNINDTWHKTLLLE